MRASLLLNVSRHLRSLCIAALLLSLGQAAIAQVDPPARAGRVTHIDGKVSFYTDRDEGWQPALLNFPVTSENSIWTEGTARAEIRFGATAIRFNDNTVFDFVRLLDDSADGYLQRGTIQIRSRGYGNIDYRDSLTVDTAEGRVTFDAGGRFRMDSAAGETRIAVMSGRARFESGDTRLGIDPGKQLVVRRGASGLDFRFEIATETGFDRWADARDQQWDRVHTRYVSETVVSPYMTGYEDLDTWGEWRDEAEYGRVWYPRAVVTDWAPYRYGRWSYVRPWGWTWIDDAAWGFAPFHYGRWVQVRNRWCWWPGSYEARPVYAPALVAWFGRPGAGITLSSGPAVGWFPLGPREHYVPHYTNNSAYIRRLNHFSGNNGAIRPPVTYRNHVQGATFVQNNVFTNGSHVGPNVARVNPRTVADQGNINQAGMPIGPRGRVSPQAPDRAQGSPGNHRSGGGNAPSPQFSSPALVPPVGGPAASTPSWRDKARPEPAASGPMPTPGPAPMYPQKQVSQPNRGGAYPVPPPDAASPATNMPATPIEPRGRRERAPAPAVTAPSPEAHGARGIQPAAPAAAPAAVPDRENRSRPPRGQRPSEPAYNAPAPAAPVHSAPPQAAPRQPVQPAALRVNPPAPPAAPQAKPPAEPSSRPRGEQGNNENPPRGEGRRPAVLPN